MLLNASYEDWINSIEITIEQLKIMEQQLDYQQIIINQKIADVCYFQNQMSDYDYNNQCNLAYNELRTVSSILSRVRNKIKVLENKDRLMAQEIITKDFNYLEKTGIVINFINNDFEELSTIYHTTNIQIDQLLNEGKIDESKANLLKDEIYVLVAYKIKNLKIKKYSLVA